MPKPFYAVILDTRAPNGTGKYKIVHRTKDEQQARDHLDTNRCSYVDRWNGKGWVYNCKRPIVS